MNNSYKSILLLLGAATVAACGNDAVQKITAPTVGALVKFHNFAVGAPSVNFYSDTTKVTAISSTSGVESATGTAYPAAGVGGVADGGFYSAIDAGAHVMSGRIPPTATTDPGITVSSANATLEAGKYYSYFQSGIYNTTTKTADAFVIEDPFIADFDYSAAYVRFVNASSNAQPMTLYATNTTTKVQVALGAAVAYKAGGAFVSLPDGIYDLSTRVTGSSTNAISRTGVTFQAGRVYTIAALGDMTVTSVTAATRPVLNQTPNR